MISTLHYPQRSRYWQKGYTRWPELLQRVLEPADSWEKTSGSTAIDQEKINTAFR